MNTAVLGLQWGDEGKVKAIDYLANRFNVVVRYQGGHNAGHTIFYQGQKVILHLLPSGVFTPDTISIIGHGVVVNPLQLVKEIKNLHDLGIADNNLFLSTAAPLILPVHQKLDIVFESSRYVKIGTTRRGIGPAYEDLCGRRALFIRDLLNKDIFLKQVKSLDDYYNKMMQYFNGEGVRLDSYIDEFIEAGKFLHKYTLNTTYLLDQLLSEGKSILFEGAQGALLDINLGTYPFVTSSNSTIGGIFTGTGISHKAVEKVIGISKAYTTRVGGGPFPSELFKKEAERLRQKGNEFGSTTGRPRRVGWLDLVALKYAIMVNGVDEIFITKLDVLDDFEEIKLVTHYEYKGVRNQIFDTSLDYLDNVETVEKTFAGWNTSIGEARSFQDLPGKAREYIQFIEDYIQITVKYISVGVERDQTIKK
ncbi:MAG: adenylosuccinate synthase [Candidatus Aminicenantes bacterium]|nr:adenylosuccinate synthase [Candidatus Aminicenantes bacterium]